MEYVTLGRTQPIMLGDDELRLVSGFKDGEGRKAHKEMPLRLRLAILLVKQRADAQP